MSVLKIPTSGKSTGEVSEIFKGRQLGMDLSGDPETPIHIKITPGTGLYDQIKVVARVCKVSRPCAARMMMRTGWLGFCRTFGREK